MMYGMGASMHSMSGNGSTGMYGYCHRNGWSNAQSASATGVSIDKRDDTNIICASHKAHSSNCIVLAAPKH